MKVAFKLMFFILLVVLLGEFNNYLTNGPVFQNNIELGIHQFKDGLMNVGDVKVGDYWISYNAIIISEVVVLGFMFFILFLLPIVKWFSNEIMKGKK